MIGFHKNALKDTLDVITEREGQGVSKSECELIKMLAKEWLDSLIQTNGVSCDVSALIDCLVTLYKNTKDKIKNDQTHYRFMILAHGGIVNIGYPSSIYYGMPGERNITNVRIFVPWGSLLNASAAASILTGEANPHGMSYIKRNFFGQENKADIYNAFGRVVAEITSFNDIPNSSQSLPCINLTATSEDENAVQLVANYIASKSLQSGVILIPYYNKGQRFFRYPDMPLYVVTSLLSLICDIIGSATEINVTCDIQSLHCLAAGKQSGFDQNVHVGTSQYYSTVPSENVEVHDRSFRPNEQKAVFEALKKLL